jgi:hypothetical protein
MFRLHVRGLFISHGILRDLPAPDHKSLELPSRAIHHLAPCSTGDARSAYPVTSLSLTMVDTGVLSRGRWAAVFGAILPHLSPGTNVYWRRNPLQFCRRKDR